ncbi:MAG: hypothetical protein ABIA04_13325 [Pseudomonadota bacterium]
MIKFNLEDLDDIKQKGLYLKLEDSTTLELSQSVIEEKYNNFIQDPSLFTEEMKEISQFRKCAVCPYKDDKKVVCTALKPIIPFLHIVDKYVSFNKIFAIYKYDETKSFDLAITDMQSGIKYLSVLSLFYYCSAGLKYWKYFAGIKPLMKVEEIAIKLYLNIYQHCGGNKNMIDDLLAKFMFDIKIINKDIVHRLRLICKNDVFYNSFVSAQVIPEFLTLDIDEIVKKHFIEHEKKAF